MVFKIYQFDWGLYPRRVILYLREKGIPENEVELLPIGIEKVGEAFPMSAPGMPVGSVPCLDLGDGKFIRQSVAILYYLESQYGSRKPNMIGETDEEQAFVRDLLSYIDEACLCFGLACQHGSRQFESMEGTSESAMRFLLDRCDANLRYLSERCNPDTTYLTDNHRVTVADCCAFSTMQFALEVYGFNLFSKYPRLERFYKAFSQRSSATKLNCPPMISEVASQWKYQY